MCSSTSSGPSSTGGPRTAPTASAATTWPGSIRPSGSSSGAACARCRRTRLSSARAPGLRACLARYAGRLDAIFDFDLAYYVRQALARGRMDAAGFATWLDEHDRAYPGLGLATVLDNHDMNRFLWMAAGNVDRLKLAATLLLTLPGMPVIYYGTEVGLSQRFDGAIENAEARLPMLWGEEQNPDLLTHFQALGRMRRDSVALRRGERRTVLADAEVFAYERKAGGESVVVALNFSEKPQRRDLPGLDEPIELGPLGSAVVPMEASTIRSCPEPASSSPAPTSTITRWPRCPTPRVCR